MDEQEHPHIVPFSSKKKVTNDKDKSSAAANSAEVRTVGSVSSKIYMKYFLNGGHWILCVLLALANILTQVLFSATDYWLSYW